MICRQWLLLLLLTHFSPIGLCVTPWTLCDPIDGSPPGSPFPGILQARTLEWVTISFSNAWKWKVKVKSLSRVRPSATPTRLPGSSVHRIFQARVLEWGAIPGAKQIQVLLLNFLTFFSPNFLFFWLHRVACRILSLLTRDWSPSVES